MMLCPVCENASCGFFLKADGRDYWRCGVCVATFVDPEQLPSADTEIAQYLLHQNDPQDEGYRSFLNQLAKPLLSRLPTGQRGLDYGCGPGPALAAMLREAGHSVALFDPFFATDRDVLSRSYDFITCTEVTEHFHRPSHEFRKLDSLLKPGGWLGLMTTFQTDDARFFHWYYRRDPTHVVFYRKETLLHLARLHGWRCEFPAPNVALMNK
jgi:SAM-dependent methyltransferase